VQKLIAALLPLLFMFGNNAAVQLGAAWAVK
jgi:hypothetical protein